MAKKRVEFYSTKCPECGHWQTAIYKTKFNKAVNEVVRSHRCNFCQVEFLSVQELQPGESYPPKSAAELVA